MPTDKMVNEKVVSGIKVKVLKKDIKNFHLNILPPDGIVRVSVPIDTSDDAVHFFVASRLHWIKKKIKSFKNQERETKREYIKNESHYVLGKRYLLDVTKSSRNYVEIIKKKFLSLYVKDPTNVKLKEKTLEKFYRQKLKAILDKEISDYQQRVGTEVKNYSIRKMKTKWGSCNTKNKTMNFNLELAKKPINSIRYVVIHELVHLLERKHNSHFVSLMDKHMPKWRNER